MKQFIIPLVLLSFTFFGCSKEEMNPSNPIQPDSVIAECKPLKITTEGVDYVQIQEFGYNSNGFEINYRRIRDGIVKARLTSYVHDTNGNVVYLQMFAEDNQHVGSERSTYSPENYRLTTTWFFDVGITQKHEWIYDSKKRESGFNKYYDDSLTHEHKNYRYDSNDSIIYYERTWAHGVNGIISKTFSASGKILSYEIKNLNQNGLVTKTEWTYNSDELINGEKYYRNGRYAGEVTNYQYDEHGNITYSEFFNENGELSTKESIIYQCFYLKVP